MLHTLVRTAGAVTFTSALLATSPAVAGDSHVVVRVYDMATTDAAARAAALRAAEQAIASADVMVDWRDCSRGGAAHPCRTVRDAGELVVRIMPTSAPGDGGELGFASLDHSGRAAVIATVYYDVVRRVSTRTGLDTKALLGRAIAHEIGHLLLRVPGHGRRGLMRSLWTDDELAQDRPGDWTFSDEESRQLREAARRPDAVATGVADDGPVEAAGR
jgi:hypothetical protein